MCVYTRLHHIHACIFAYALEFTATHRGANVRQDNVGRARVSRTAGREARHPLKASAARATTSTIKKKNNIRRLRSRLGFRVVFGQSSVLRISVVYNLSVLLRATAQGCCFFMILCRTSLEIHENFLHRD